MDYAELMLLVNSLFRSCYIVAAGGFGLDLCKPNPSIINIATIVLINQAGSFLPSRLFHLDNIIAARFISSLSTTIPITDAVR